jgi:hypothetical protein
MRLAARFALIALLPATLSPAAVSANVLQMQICSGDGQTRVLAIPLGPRVPPGEGDSPCCVKGCHAGGSRKRGSCHI